MKLLVKNVSILGLFLFLCISLNAQTIENSGDVAMRLREFYQLRAFDDGVAEGKKLAAKFPDNSEVNAWFIVHKVMTYDPNVLDEAREFAGKNEDDMWANFALVTALLNRYEMDEALRVSEKLAASENEDFIFARADVLARNLMTAEALKFLKEKAEFIADKSRLETVRGEVYYLSETVGDKAKAYAAFKTAQKLNPNNLDAFFLEGNHLIGEENYDKAIIPLRSAVKLSPSSFAVRQTLWQALWFGQARKSQTIKKREITAEIELFRKLSPDTAKRLSDLSTIFGYIEMPQKQTAYEEILLKNFGDSVEAENVLMNRINVYSYEDENGEENPARKKQYALMLAAFFKRPHYFNQDFLGSVYERYLAIVKDDKTISDKEYVRLGSEAVKYRTSDISAPFPVFVEGLIERGQYVEAEKYALIGMAKLEERLKIVEEDQVDPEFLENEGKDARKILNNLLGEAFLRQKKYKDAEKYLRLSIEDGKEGNRAVNLLGELYEETGDFDKAENYYIETVALYDDDYEPDYKNLQKLYEKRNQTTDGYDEYLEKIKLRAKKIRRDDILSHKNIEPTDLQPFSLKMADGKPFLFENLRKKITVINVWAVWCGPCIKEMPELQGLQKKYLTDKDVAIITINAGDAAESINDFMSENKYKFPVILGEDYVDNVKAIPTTWFVDRNGKVIYTKVGSTKNLIEEYSWRIEELRKN